MLVRDVFPNKEVGDYMNNEVIFIKYELDVDDSDNIKSKHNIYLYPTFLVLNSEGQEVNRAKGRHRDSKEFISLVKTAVDSNFSYSAYEQRMEEDLSTGFQYAEHLNQIGRYDMASDVIHRILEGRSFDENFSAESLKLYDNIIRTPNNPVLMFMLEKSNIKRIKNVMGDKEYHYFIIKKCNDMVIDMTTHLSGVDEGRLNAFVQVAKKQPNMRGDFVKFIIENENNLIERKIGVMIKAITEYVKKANTNEIDYFIDILESFPSPVIMSYKKNAVIIYQEGANKSNNRFKKSKYNISLDYYKSKL